MKYCILMGSPRKNGNTISITRPFIEELEENVHDVEMLWLHDMNIKPCEACRVCQKDWDIFGCKYDDDMQIIFDAVRSSDVLVLATPIYGWYCTGPMKLALDRLIYGMCKYYGDEKGPAIWEGKPMAIITTCGYKPEKGADVFIEGMRRSCKHCGLTFAGAHAERDLGYKTVFIDEDKIQRARNFANELMGKL